MAKVIFKKMKLEDNIKFIKDIFDDADDELLSVHTFTINLFPELKNISNSMCLEDRDKLIESVVANYYHDNSLNIDNDVERYNNVWNRYNDDFFNKLTKFLNLEWPREHEVVEATVGIIPVCPRYLDEFSFSVHDGLTDVQLIETCAHELCHFLWFEKWKKLYPDCPRKEYESPYVVWQYSEAVVDPILKASGIKELFNSNNVFSYDSFYENYDNLMNELIDIYLKDLDIDTRINEGFNCYRKITSQKR